MQAFQSPHPTGHAAKRPVPVPAGGVAAAGEVQRVAVEFEQALPAMYTLPDRPAGSTQRHIEILDAMTAHDVAAAQEAAAIHLAEVEERTLADMASHEIVT